MGEVFDIYSENHIKNINWENCTLLYLFYFRWYT